MKENSQSKEHTHIDLFISRCDYFVLVPLRFTTNLYIYAQGLELQRDPRGGERSFQPITDRQSVSRLEQLYPLFRLLKKF